jgi:hypothetical protein
VLNGRRTIHPHGAAAVYQRRHGLDDAALAALLSCNVAVLTPLRLCCRPGAAEPSWTWEADVADIARRFGLDAAVLERVVGEVIAGPWRPAPLRRPPPRSRITASIPGETGPSCRRGHAAVASSPSHFPSQTDRSYVRTQSCKARNTDRYQTEKIALQIFI